MTGLARLSEVAEWTAPVFERTGKRGIDPELVLRVMWEESRRLAAGGAA